MKEAADPGKIRKVNKQVVTQNAPTPANGKKVGAAADRLLARKRARRTAQMSVNLNPQLGTGV